jgi:hypothetical protein
MLFRLDLVYKSLLKHASGQLGSSSGTQTDEVLGLEFMHVEHVGIVQNPNKKEN